MLVEREIALKSPEPDMAVALGITPRMLDVLELALDGLPAKKIASTLGINDSNVRHYLSRLYERFGVTSRYGLHARIGPSVQILREITSSQKKGMAK